MIAKPGLALDAMAHARRDPTANIRP